MRKNYSISNVVVDTNRLTQLENEAMALFESVVSKYGKNWLIAFSGGKDSVVIAHLARKFEISKGVCEESFCFPKDCLEFREMAKKMRLDVEYYNSLSDSWLSANSKYIFPIAKDSGVFYSKRQQATIKRKAKGYTGVITGRRTEENTVRSKLYQTKNGLWNFHPIAHWTTYDIWSYIKWRKLPYLSIYSTELGMLEGATPWCNISRAKIPSENKCWMMVYKHDPSYFTSHIINHYPQARKFYENELS